MRLMILRMSRDRPGSIFRCAAYPKGRVGPLALAEMAQAVRAQVEAFADAHAGHPEQQERLETRSSVLHHDSTQVDQARTDVYNPATGSWSSGPDLPMPHSHAEGRTFLSGGRIFMMGGMTRGRSGRQVEASIWVLSSDDGEWSVLGELPQPLSSPAAAIIGGRLVVAGGSPDGKDPQPGVWVRDAP